MPIPIEEVLNRAERCVATYEEIVRNVPFEKKGILYSEMLFLYSFLEEGAPGRLL